MGVSVCVRECVCWCVKLWCNLPCVCTIYGYLSALSICTRTCLRTYLILARIHVYHVSHIRMHLILARVHVYARTSHIRMHLMFVHVPVCACTSYLRAYMFAHVHLTYTYAPHVCARTCLRTYFILARVHVSARTSHIRMHLMFVHVPVCACTSYLRAYMFAHVPHIYACTSCSHTYHTQLSHTHTHTYTYTQPLAHVPHIGALSRYSFQTCHWTDERCPNHPPLYETRIII